MTTPVDTACVHQTALTEGAHGTHACATPDFNARDYLMKGHLLSIDYSEIKDLMRISQRNTT
jgi:hypothetical protein